MTSLPLPQICITCPPPWPQAMMHAGKNLENRDASVAARLAPFVGQNIGISQSKTWIETDASRIAESLMRSGHIGMCEPEAQDWANTAGKLLLVARLDRIAKPSEYGRNPWHIAGQHGLVLGKVWQVEPVTCAGGAGAWEPTWCVKCGHVIADNACMTDRKTKAAKPCPSCKTPFPMNRMNERERAKLDATWPGEKRPQLRIVRECQ